ncbi:MAG: flagellar basal body-associated protein FliL [Bosea sp. (in: a-proteobacteria)]|nr:flagellar basal body-associated protein FliL [Bosea sp. (in: a-proteobacteria)]
MFETVRTDVRPSRIRGRQAMAKKPKTDADSAPAEGAAEGGGKSKKKLIMIVGGVVLLAALGGGGWFFFLKKPSPEQIAAAEAAASAKKPVAFIEMKDMIIGITGGPQQERQPMIKIKVVLETADAKISDEIKPLLPRVEDAFQVFMRELRPSDLEGSAGMYRLKEELLRRVNVTVFPAKIDAVLFKELLIQ